MKKWAMLLVLVAISGTATQSSAEGFEPLRNVYVAAGPVISFANGDASGGTNFRDQFGTGVGFMGYLGAPLSDHLFGQLGFAGDFYDKGASDLELYWFTAEIKAIALRGRVQPYFLAGLGAAVGAVKQTGPGAVEDTNVEFTYVLGAGVDFYVRPSVAIAPEVRIRGLDDSGGTGIELFPVVNLGVNFLFVFQ